MLALLLLAGCANGDFGEVRPSLVRDNIHNWVGREAIAGHPVRYSRFERTDDERQLRDLAYPLVEPSYDRKQWYSIFGEYGAIGAPRRTSFDRTAYTDRLFQTRHWSPASRYAQLIDDVRNDTTRLSQFFETAARVTDIDRKRRQSLSHISGLGAEERSQALARIRENELIVSWVHHSLARREATYRFALERLVLITPTPQAVDVERAINQLKAEATRYRSIAPPGRTAPARVAIAR